MHGTTTRTLKASLYLTFVCISDVADVGKVKQACLALAHLIALFAREREGEEEWTDSITQRERVRNRMR